MKLTVYCRRSIDLFCPEEFRLRLKLIFAGRFVAGAERRICEVAGQYEVDELILRFINRLSDYLFVLSRFMNVEEGIEEIYWNNSCE